METNTWYNAAAEHQSLGSQAARPGSLAGLHKAREEHLSQFFTPAAVAQVAWNIVAPAIAAAQEKFKERIALFDNAIGSGRLMQFANPEHCKIFGNDIHAESVEVLNKALKTAGFETEIIVSGMEDVHPNGMHVSLINPPFSIRLESPNLTPYPCTTWGKFGRNTSAISHAYAFHQAIDASQITVAVLPSTYVAQLAEEEIYRKVVAIVHLPKGAFREENTEVDTALVIATLWENDKPPTIVRLDSFSDPLPDLGLELISTKINPRLNHVDGYINNGPSIHLPVTGDKTVKVSHDGRRIRLAFNCGLTQARVANAILKESVRGHMPPDHRYPKGVKFTGQGVLDVETHLAQDDAMMSFKDFIAAIEKAGGVPVVDPGLIRYIQRRARELQRRRTPFRHVVKVPFQPELSCVIGKARKTHMAVANVFGSPVIRAGEEFEFSLQNDGTYTFELSGKIYSLTRDEMHNRFLIEQTGESAGDGWMVVHEGRNVAFPELAHNLELKAKRLGLDKLLSWSFQFHDLIELSIAPGDAIVAWKMGLGKARLAIALVLLSECKHGLIAVESQLIEEMEAELKGMGLPVDQWQTIKSPSQLRDLKRLNLISYERLRMPIDQRHARRTYASQLRRRIGTLVADEGHLLRKPDTAQTRALWQISARRKYILTGTPAANYPRDIHPLMVYEGGDGTAIQPYGWQRGYLEKNQRQSMSYAQRGIDAFREHYIVTEWVTNAFAEDNTNGAKREVPKIANLEAYRRSIACHVKRRVDDEPEVAKDIRIPKPKVRVTEIEWDESHLAHYLRVSEEFSAWYRKVADQAGKKGKQVNLIALLARIGAVQFACNFPQRGHEKFGAYSALTSKQRYALERVAQLVEEGRKIILYAENPGVLDLLHRHLSGMGIDSLVFHGGQNIKARTRELNRKFRFGSVPVLLASLGVTQTGLNIPQANYVIFYDRSWTATEEDQAGARVLRPQQQNEVDFEYLHLAGGIDVYQAQMVDHKRDSISAGVDWATPELADVEFLHLDTLLGRFCEDLGKQFGVKGYELRHALAA
jgi:hypothetical protein